MASLWSGSERPFIFLVKDKKRNPFIFGSLVVFVGCRFGSEWCVWITKRQQDEKPNDPCHWMVADTVKPYPLIFINVSPGQLWITLSILYPYRNCFSFLGTPYGKYCHETTDRKTKGPLHATWTYTRLSDHEDNVKVMFALKMLLQDIWIMRSYIFDAWM